MNSFPIVEISVNVSRIRSKLILLKIGFVDFNALNFFNKFITNFNRVFIYGELFCDTLENPYINNERNISCIPAGQYKVRLRTERESATRYYLHLLVKDVPNRSYILFHRGNTAKDTRGCILVGQTRKQNRVNNSRLAMDLIVREILNLGGENINLIIKNK